MWQSSDLPEKCVSFTGKGISKYTVIRMWSMLGTAAPPPPPTLMALMAIPKSEALISEGVQVSPHRVNTGIGNARFETSRGTPFSIKRFRPFTKTVADYSTQRADGIRITVWDENKAAILDQVFSVESN